MAKKGNPPYLNGNTLPSPHPQLTQRTANTPCPPTAKSRTIAVRIISMAMTGYYKTLVRPRVHRPLSMMKYDPVGMFSDLDSQ